MPRRPRSPASSGDGDDPRFYFDADAARDAVEFIECLRLRVGDFQGQRMKLMPYQREIVEKLFGWRRRADGKMRYRRLSLWIGRGNGKTPFMAAIMLCLLFTSGEKGADLYSVAGDTDQARIAFEDGAFMVREDPVLKSVTREYRREIQYPRNGSVWKVLSAEAKTKHGLRPYAVGFDELHVQASRDLWAAMKTGLGKRKDGLLITTSTAGVFDVESLAWCEYDFARKVRDGAIDAPDVLPVIFEASPDDDWTSPEVWKKANPGLGYTIFEDTLRAECEQAKEQPAALAEFLQFRLNIWVNAAHAAIDMNAWDACDLPVMVEQRPRAWAGFDIGERDDLSALTIVVPHADGTASVTMDAWIAAEKVTKLEHAHGVPYGAWIRDGYIRVTDGNSVDVEHVRARLRQLRESYDIREVAFDPWNAYALAQRLADDDRFTVVEVRQGTKTLSEPTKDFLARIPERKWRHGGHPVLRWMASNLTLRRDANGNVAPSKSSKNAKIDGIAALITAWSRARLANAAPSVYERRGVFVL